MEVLLPLLFPWIVLAILFAPFFIVTFILETKRTSGLRREASKLGLQFVESPTAGASGDSLERKFVHFPLFQQGDKHRLYNHFASNSSDPPFQFFDYEFKIKVGKSGWQYDQSVLIVEALGQRAIPDFCMRPETFTDKVMALGGKDDIDFGEDAFSKAFHLSSQAEKTELKKLFSAEVQAALLCKRSLSIETAKDQLLFYYKNKRIPAKLVPCFIEDCLQISRLLLAS